jgi:uncharacterized membrane protein
MLRSWPWLIASIFCAGVIHILAVFGVPFLASRDAWARLSQISSENRIQVLSVAASDTPLPFMAPDIAHAFCRFDLTKNNVLVKTALGDGTWSIAVSGRHGENFYFISGAEAKRRELRLLLVPRSRLAEEVSTERSEEGDEQIIVITPEMQGLVVLRAPIRGPSFAADTVKALQNAECRPVAEPIAEPEVAPAPQPVPPAVTSAPNRKMPRRAPREP